MRVVAKLDLVSDDTPFVAEDEFGNQYNYGSEGFPARQPDLRAADRLGVAPRCRESKEESPSSAVGVTTGVFTGWDHHGSGLIAPEDGSADLSVHEAAVSDSTDLEPGQRVTFEIETNRATEQPMAVRVYKVLRYREEESTRA